MVSGSGKPLKQKSWGCMHVSWARKVRHNMLLDVNAMHYLNPAITLMIFYFKYSHDITKRPVGLDAQLFLCLYSGATRLYRFPIGAQYS